VSHHAARCVRGDDLRTRPEISKLDIPAAVRPRLRACTLRADIITGGTSLLYSSAPSTRLSRGRRRMAVAVCQWRLIIRREDFRSFRQSAIAGLRDFYFPRADLYSLLPSLLFNNTDYAYRVSRASRDYSRLDGNRRGVRFPADISRPRIPSVRIPSVEFSQTNGKAEMPGRAKVKRLARRRAR
jgi:hypothetical protein